MACGIFGATAEIAKAVSLARFADPQKPFETPSMGIHVALFMGPVLWIFLHSLVVPYLVALPNFAKLQRLFKQAFIGCAGLCAALMLLGFLVQLAKVREEHRIWLSAAFFVCMDCVASTVLIGVAHGGWKVSGGVVRVAVGCCVECAQLTRTHASHRQLFRLLGQAQRSTLNGNTIRDDESSSQRRDPALSTKLRRTLKLKLFFIAILSSTAVVLLTGTLLYPPLQTRTWIVFPMLVMSGIGIIHLLLFFVPSSKKAGISSASYSQSLIGKKSHKCQVIPSPGAAPHFLIKPVALLVRSQLDAAMPVQNKPEFLPPQQQPRGGILKNAARLLEDAMNEHGSSIMNDAIMESIEH